MTRTKEVFRGFARMPSTVLDCANGCQKEDQKEGCEAEEDHAGEKDRRKKARAKEKDSQEIGET